MKHVIVGIGEILWDVFPTGKALGGAPANFAYHATRLGAEGWAISAVGHDGLGQEIMDVVKQKNLKNIISVTDKPTGTVMVTLDEKGIPSYDITRDVAWDNIPFTPEMKELAARTTAVCFGSLMQRDMTSRTTAMEFIKAMPEGSLKVFDINLRQHYYSEELISASMAVADILKINDEEIRVVADLYGIEGSDEDVCRRLIERYSLKLVILTKGADGSEVVTSDEVIDQKVGKVDVVDTVGAGDSFTAAFIVSYLNGESFEVAQRKASEVAAYVCAHKGAMPE